MRCSGDKKKEKVENKADHLHCMSSLGAQERGMRPAASNTVLLTPLDAFMPLIVSNGSFPWVANDVSNEPEPKEVTHA